MLYPTLYLAFKDQEYSYEAATQHICLCRNEDLMLPIDFEIMTDDEFTAIDGFELHHEKNDRSFIVGYNRYQQSELMFGWIEISGNPVRGS